MDNVLLLLIYMAGFLSLLFVAGLISDYLVEPYLRKREYDENKS
jgi:hypothetical protein